MDAASDIPFEDRRYRREISSRRVSMTESEFEQAVADGLPKLIATARRLAGNDDLAAEAVQNALLKASRSWRRFQGRSQIQTWLTRILIHAVRDVIAAKRKQAAKRTPVPNAQDASPQDQLPDPSRTPEDTAVAEETYAAIRAAVADLPDRQREVFSLMIWQNQSAVEVGEILEIDAQSVHANLYAARKRLRSVLRHFSPDASED